MGSISRETFKDKYGDTKTDNTGIDYTSRLHDLESVNNIKKSVDKVVAYTNKNLSELKNNITTGEDISKLQEDYKNVVTQRQSARWINKNPSKRGNKSLMSKETFKIEAKKLLPETTKLNEYETVFFLLQKLNILDNSINISQDQARSRKNESEKQKFLALVKFQDGLQSKKYNTTEGAKTNSGSLEVDGIIGGGTLQALLEAYKNKDIIEDTDQEKGKEEPKQKEQDEIIKLSNYKGFSLGTKEIVLEGGGIITPIDPNNIDGEPATLGGFSYQKLIEETNTDIDNIKVKKDGNNNYESRIYYKKENNLRKKDTNFKNKISNQINDIKTNTEIIDANIVFIKNAKTKFETAMNDIDLTKENNKTWRDYELIGGSFGDFEGKNLREKDTLATIGIKQLSFKENRFTTGNNKTEISMEFDYKLETGFSAKGSYELENGKTIVNYERDKTKQKLIITEGLSQAEQERQEREKQEKEEEKNEKIEDSKELNQENFNHQKFILHIQPQTGENVSGGTSARFNTKDFFDQVNSNRNINSQNYIILDPRGVPTHGNSNELRAIPTTRNRETSQRDIDKTAINNGDVYKTQNKEFKQSDRKNPDNKNTKNDVFEQYFHKVEGVTIR